MIFAYAFYCMHLEFDFLSISKAIQDYYLPGTKLCNEDIVVDWLDWSTLEPYGLLSLWYPFNISTVD